VAVRAAPILIDINARYLHGDADGGAAADFKSGGIPNLAAVYLTS
jgi:hypothetical protein